MSWLIAGGIKHIPWDSPGRGLWDTCAWFPRDSTPRAFSLCWLYFVSFHWHKSWPWTYVCYVLSPSESPNPSWGLSWGSWHAFQTCYASWVFLSQLVSPFNPVSRVRNLRSILDCSLGASTKSCQFALEVSLESRLSVTLVTFQVWGLVSSPRTCHSSIPVCFSASDLHSSLSVCHLIPKPRLSS